MTEQLPNPTDFDPALSSVADPTQSAKEQLAELRDQVSRIEQDDRKAAEYLDRVVLVGGSAAILASVSFLKDIAPTPAPGSLLLLQLSWAMFLVGAALGVLALVTTRSTARGYARMLRDKIRDNNPTIRPADYDPIRRTNEITKWASRAGLVLFIGGAIFLVGFAINNLPRASAETEGSSSKLEVEQLLRVCATASCTLTIVVDSSTQAVEIDGLRASPQPGDPND